MKLANGTTNIEGLRPVMRHAMKIAEEVYIENGEEGGVTIVHGLDGIHSAGSWHYCGCAVDIRNNMFDDARKKTMHQVIKDRLPGYDVILHDTHLHIEPGNALAGKWGLLL